MPAPKGGNSGSMKPGTTLNPNGRPKTGESLTDLARKVMETIPIDLNMKGQKKKFKQLFIEAMLKQAIKNPDGAAATRLMQHIDGMPIQKTIVEQTNITAELDSLDAQKQELSDWAKKKLGG